jgi:dTDP-4-dehydrorhamnose 3,5-epimerase
VTEIFREVWNLGCRPVQLNAIANVAGALRGVHVHVRHADYLVLIAGRMVLGLHDLRPWSPTARASCLTEIDASAPCAVVIPVGVAHGFFFPVPSVVVCGVSHYWDPADELGCRWDAAELNLAWPTRAPVLSDRDATAGDYAAFCKLFTDAWREAGETGIGRNLA